MHILELPMGGDSRLVPPQEERITLCRLSVLFPYQLMETKLEFFLVSPIAGCSED